MRLNGSYKGKGSTKLLQPVDTFTGQVNYSNEVKQLIKDFLKTDPERRLTAREALYKYRGWFEQMLD